MRGKNADPGENFFNEKTFTTLRQRMLIDMMLLEKFGQKQ